MPSICTIFAPQFHTSFFFFHASPTPSKSPRIAVSWTMNVDSDFSTAATNKKKKELPVQLSTPLSTRVETSRFGDLRFHRSQPSDQEFDPHRSFEFGQFVAREALLDDEYGAAAWLRAEWQWENRIYELERYSDFIRKFAIKEFNAIKKRCQEQTGDIYTCIIAARKEKKNVKRSIIKSVVGTLDLSIRYLLPGETFPGERPETPKLCRVNGTPSGRYGYIANLCVAKSTRRQRIATNTLYFAVESAKSIGASRVYAHVDRSNEPALMLYQNLGFEIVEMANPLLLKDQTYLLRLQM